MEEGGSRPLNPLLLNAADLDAPADLLTFTVVTPPAHGRLVRCGREGVEPLRRRPRPLSTHPAVTTFTLQELQQGEGAGLEAQTPVNHIATSSLVLTV